MKDSDINACYFIQEIVQSYFCIISNLDTYCRINYSVSLFSPYICRLSNSSITFLNFGPLAAPLIYIPQEKVFT